LVRQFDHVLVDKTPSPTFRRIVTLYDRMLRGMEMCGCVTPRGLVAAPDMAALAAESQVKPSLPGLKAFLAAERFGPNRADRRCVRAGVRHGFIPR
jgi:hypothetical protein